MGIYKTSNRLSEIYTAKTEDFPPNTSLTKSYLQTKCFLRPSRELPENELKLTVINLYDILYLQSDFPTYFVLTQNAIPYFFSIV